MKQISQCILVFMVLIVFQGKAAAQPLNNDSITRVRIHQLAQILSLSASQEQAFFNLEKKQTDLRDSVAHLQLSLDDRKQWLTSNLKDHDKELKKIFSEKQWKDYKAILKKRREEFMQHNTDKKIKTNEITRDNN